MPAHRDPGSGEIVDTPTVKTRDDAPAIDSPTEKKTSSRPGSVDASAYEAKTVKAGSARATSPQRDETADAKTRILRRSGQSSCTSAAQTNEDHGAETDAMDDPPAGWLVIIEGPGQGNCLAIGYGSNSIGRERGERICLDFGDERISRTQHAIVTYDPRGRKFFIQHGGGKNLTYLDEEPVLAPAPLEPQAHIQIADTLLRFVPLCGDDFDWPQD